MSIPVRNEYRTAEGWFLTTLDDYEDILAGPFKTSEDARDAADELQLTIELQDNPVVGKKYYTVQDMPLGHLFRIGGYWHRVVACPEKPRRLYTLSVVGTERIEQIDGKTPVSEISVLNLT